MKKNRIKNFSKSLISASLRGLAVFAIFGAALFVYAEVNYPDTAPGPVSGIVGLYVGKTVATYDGNDAGSYQNANALCSGGGVDLEDSHVCTPMEIINTYNHDPSGPISTEVEALWLNSGAPAFYSAVTNDCLGWTTSANLYGQPVYGSVWLASEKYGMMTFCSQSLNYACCK